VAVFFLAWLALIFVLGARGVFVAPRGAPPLALLIGLLVPLSLFLLGYRTIRPLREFVLSADLKPYCGDAGVEMGRLWVSDFVHLRSLAWNLRLACRARRYGDRCDCSLGVGCSPASAGFAAGKSFVAWNLSGILDLTVAVSIGALVPLLAPNFYGAVSTAPMTQLPLVLVPTYLVPTFLILHLTALFQARRLGR
jgi:hypothetical protein